MTLNINSTKNNRKQIILHQCFIVHNHFNIDDFNLNCKPLLINTSLNVAFKKRDTLPDELMNIH